MTDTIEDMSAQPVEQWPAAPAIDEQGVAEQLVSQAREKGIELVGPNGLLQVNLGRRCEQTTFDTNLSAPRGRSLLHLRRHLR
jgi:hypothetical protein